MTNKWCLVTFCGMLTLLTALGERSIEAGNFVLSGHDLTIDVDDRWIGCREGGYYPIRIKARNIGPARRITFQLDSANSGEGVPTVSRSIDLEQNATVNLALLVPMVADSSYGMFRVQENGITLKNMTQNISLPQKSYTYNRGLSLLIVSDSLKDGQYYNKASGQFSNTYGHGSSHYHYGGYASDDYSVTIDSSMLPENWVAYTGLDILAISLPTLDKKLSAEIRQAIFTWVESGGILLVYDVGALTGVLDGLCNWSGRQFAQSEWEEFRQQDYIHLSLPDPADESRTIPEDFTGKKIWNLSQELAALRGLGLGKVIRFVDDPFPGSVSDWGWLIKQINSQPVTWDYRNGINSRKGNSTFMNFLIPGVGGIPIISFLFLITIFTVLIGPVNYGYFLRKKQLAMLLITVPVLAFGSSALLVAYSTVSNGFSTKTRIRSLTVLDQLQKTSLSISRVAYFSGMAPSQGLKFEPTSAVYPIWPTADSFENARLSWGEQQHLESGWLRSRTRTQFLVVTPREQRGRLDLNTKNNQLTVSNGLEWRLEKLLIADAQGNVYVGKDINAGAVAELQPADEKELQAFREQTGEDQLKLPDGLEAHQVQQMMKSSHRRGYYYGADDEEPDYYANSRQESFVKQILGPGNAVPQPGQYFAILDENPDLDLGMNNARVRQESHLLIGYLD